MSTIRSLQKRIDRIEAERSPRESEVIYRIMLSADDPVPELLPGQRLWALVEIFPARWAEVARG